MIKTRIVKFVGHIHNMQLCIEMISFINNENESLLRWFYSLCEPRNFSRILCPVAGCIQTGWGSDLWLTAVVLWNSAPHVSTMWRITNVILCLIWIHVLTKRCRARQRCLRSFSWPFGLGTAVPFVNEINDYWEIEPLFCKWLCPGQMWIR